MIISTLRTVGYFKWRRVCIAKGQFTTECSTEKLDSQSTHCNKHDYDFTTGRHGIAFHIMPKTLKHLKKNL